MHTAVITLYPGNKSSDLISKTAGGRLQYSNTELLSDYKGFF